MYVLLNLVTVLVMTPLAVFVRRCAVFRRVPGALWPTEQDGVGDHWEASSRPSDSQCLETEAVTAAQSTEMSW